MCKVVSDLSNNPQECYGNQSKQRLDPLKAERTDLFSQIIKY